MSNEEAGRKVAQRLEATKIFSAARIFSWILPDFNAAAKYYSIHYF